METNQQQPDLVAETREQAQQQIAELRGNADFTRALINGDSATVSRWSSLHDAAYGPEPVGDFGIQNPAPLERAAPAALPGEAVPDGEPLRPGDPGFDEANAAAFAPPKAAHEYRLEVLGGTEATDADIADMMSVSSALFAAEVPTFAVQLVQQVAQHNVKDGELTDAQLEEMHTNCMATLQQRHGDSAQAVIADAKKVIARVINNAAIREYLDITGAGSNPHVIETLARVWREHYAKRG